MNEKVAVLGSGVMGSGIAAHMANAGFEVLLLDIVPEGAKDRNQLSKAALEKLKKQKPAALTHPDFVRRITPGNLADDLPRLKDCFWVVEAVLEKIEIKRDLYEKVLPHLASDAVISSNTSTLPLHELMEAAPEALRHRFLITHFFNPPRYMRLLEVVRGPKTDAKLADRIERIADERLGKGIVHAKDTPGFIANRLGVYWLLLGLTEAMRLGLTVEEADAVMSRPVGIPKTGVFGLYDLIGIDLMPLIAKGMLQSLPEGDAFLRDYAEPELVTKMIADGYTGRKGKGGFYRLNTEGGKKEKESISLATGEYATSQKPRLESVDAAKGGLQALVTHQDKGGQYAAAVLLPFLHYSASLVAEISEGPQAVDEAMRWGYNWKFGPFELIDKLGAEWFAGYCREQGWNVPAIIETAGGKSFYRSEGGRREVVGIDGQYRPLQRPEGSWLLIDRKAGTKPVKKNGSASLWDLGDGVLGLEFTSKMNSLDPDILTMMQEVPEVVRGGFTGLVIGNDGDNFSVGANLGFFLYAANLAAHGMLEGVVKQGQDALMGLKYAPFPVVGAPSGMALGGGCETLLHCDAVQAHVELYAGLVEVGVGVIPGWGGCKEMLLRHVGKKGIGGAMPALKAVFEIIGMAKVSESAEIARDMGILNEKSRISMNRQRVLPDAKALVLELAKGYAPPEPATIRLPGKSAKIAMDMAVKGMAALGKVTPHDLVVSDKLGNVLSGGNTGPTRDLSEQDLLDLERENFMELVKNKATLARIEHMLETGKPLRN